MLKRKGSFWYKEIIVRDYITADEWVEYLNESYEYYKERDAFFSLRFYIRGIKGRINDPHLMEAVQIFRDLGFHCDCGDTYLFDFDLDNNWYVFDCPKCIRDYAYSVPYTDSASGRKKLARFIELVHKSKIIVFVKHITID